MTIKRATVIVLLLAAPALARNIDLSTVPARDTVQLTIYNAEDLTLVRETRQITFGKGINPLQFSWANTLIDPTSVQIRFPKSADVLELLDTTYPHDKPEMLYWSIQSEIDGEAQVEITYFTSGLTWSADYECITNPDETQMDITGYVRVFNRSGEEYEEAQVRLVVGQINLVEAIAELAKRRYGVTVEGLGGEERSEVRRGALNLLFDNFADGKTTEAGVPMIVDRPKEVAKEALGEYFIYTVEGTETIPDGWSKRMRSFEGSDIGNNDTVEGWADHSRYVERIRNYRGKPIEIEIRRPFEGHAFFVSDLDPTKHDYQTVQMTATCPPGRKTELGYEIRTLQGYLAKQQNVTLEKAE